LSRNNAGRMTAAAATLPQMPQQSAASLPVPTEIVELPSRGELYPPDHPWHNKSQVEIKLMTAKEEDILSNQAFMQNGSIFEKLITSVLTDGNVDSQSILSVDRNAILIAIRESGYGPDYSFNIACPSCGDNNISEFDLTERVVATPEIDSEVTNTGRGTFLITLPKSKYQAEVRPLTGADELKISKNIKSAFTVTSQLKRIIVSINGNSDSLFLDSAIENIPAFDSKYLRKLSESLLPSVKMEFDFICSSCDHRSALEVPITLAFFWPNK